MGSRGRRNNLPLSTGLSLALVAGPAGAATISFQEGVAPTGAYAAPSTYIRTTQADSNQDNDGDDENIVGFNGAEELRGLYAFDLSAIAAASSGNPFTIDAVRLVQRTRNSAGSGTSFTSTVHAYGFAFNEGTSTWNDPDGDGGDLTGDPVDGGTLGTALSITDTYDPTTNLNADVTFPDTPAFRAAVLSAATAGEPLRLIATGSGGFTRFLDETVGTAGNRPELIVDYTVVPEPASAAAAGLALLGLLARRPSRRR